ncbi:KUN-3, putative, partial [Ixodes scapularis]
EDVCKMNPPKEVGHAISPGWFYNASIDLCLYYQFGAHKHKNEKSNRFSSLSECSKACRSPDLGPCALLPSELECNHDDTLYYRYNLTSESCYLDKTYRGKRGDNAFPTLNACYARCGNPVDKRCVPDPSLKDCKPRDDVFYRYDQKQGECFLDHSVNCPGRNGFVLKEECNKICASKMSLS